MDDLAAFVRGVLLDLDGAGALADTLQERSREREAVLLRRRWKAWQKQRAATAERTRAKEHSIAAPMQAAVASLRAAGFQCEASIHVKVSEDTTALKRHDDLFASYIRSRFAGVRVEQVRYWFRAASFSHAVVSVSSGMVATACGSLMSGAVSDRDRTPPKAICRKCRKALTTMTLRQPTEATT